MHAQRLSQLTFRRAHAAICVGLSGAVLLFGACRSRQSDEMPAEEGSESTATKQTVSGLRSIIGPSFPSPLTVDQNWRGTRALSRRSEILILAGHADAQCVDVGAPGTAGFAVSKKGAPPMSEVVGNEGPPETRGNISDELFGAIAIAKEVVSQGRKAGLIITFYDPFARPKVRGNGRCIVSPDDPDANWKRGMQIVKRGGYALEIHLDAWGQAGVGAGLIPPVGAEPTNFDERLARTFGRFPKGFRELGGPRRGVSFLEVGKLEDPLESKLRSESSRQATIQTIARNIVAAFTTSE